MSNVIIKVIAGPTASGKSALAIQIARQCDGVIINADALQVYDALPLLTARPSDEDLAQAPHLLYATIPATEICSATRWTEMAVAAIRETLADGRTPILVGGTGLYLKTLMEGLSPVPPVPAGVRTMMIERQRALGNPAFHAAFAAHDPVMAARLHSNDTQRLIRAWEVLEATGESLSVWQAKPPQPPVPAWRYDVQILDPARDILYQRCNQRFLMMMEQGALQEVAAYDARMARGEVLDQGGVTQALGFWPLRAHLHGDMSLAEAINLAQTDTRQYAKRQVTWLRNQV
ncbi:MAG TPA: tRNA (adenosine(37)-N6)-dimethylallyltransferase MiaA, partial [Micavibrio sp.]